MAGSIGLAGLVVGPSFGHYYIGDVKSGLVGTGIRVGAFAYALVAGRRDDTTGVGIGLVVAASSMLFEWGHTVVSTKERNAALRAKARPGVVVAPSVVSGIAGPAPGVVLGGTW